jgi:hypothetical protein
MSHRHRRTLEAVFRDPVSATIVWSEIESMLLSFGAHMREGSGSRLAIELNEQAAHIHRPHPRKEASQFTVREVRDLLIRAGITP